MVFTRIGLLKFVDGSLVLGYSSVTAEGNPRVLLHVILDAVVHLLDNHLFLPEDASSRFSYACAASIIVEARPGAIRPDSSFI
jgi:hypothetical protein